MADSHAGGNSSLRITGIAPSGNRRETDASGLYRLPNIRRRRRSVLHRSGESVASDADAADPGPTDADVRGTARSPKPLVVGAKLEKKPIHDQLGEEIAAGGGGKRLRKSLRLLLRCRRRCQWRQRRRRRTLNHFMLRGFAPQFTNQCLYLDDQVTQTRLS